MHPVFNVPQIPLPALFINELISILGESGWREMTLHLALSFINIIPTLWCSGGGALRAFWSVIGGDQRETVCMSVMLHVKLGGQDRIA